MDRRLPSERVGSLIRFWCRARAWRPSAAGGRSTTRRAAITEIANAMLDQCAASAHWIWRRSRPTHDIKGPDPRPATENVKAASRTAPLSIPGGSARKPARFRHSPSISARRTISAITIPGRYVLRRERCRHDRALRGAISWLRSGSALPKTAIRSANHSDTSAGAPTACGAGAPTRPTSTGAARADVPPRTDRRSNAFRPRSHVARH